MKSSQKIQTLSNSPAVLANQTALTLIHYCTCKRHKRSPRNCNNQVEQTGKHGEEANAINMLSYRETRKSIPNAVEHVEIGTRERTGRATGKDEDTDSSKETGV
jgi:hypothetical protein